MIRHLLTNGIRAKLAILLLGVFAFGPPALTPSPAAADSPCPYKGGHRNLHAPDTGADVKHAQCLLNLAGWGEYSGADDRPLEEDGIFGPETEAAVKLAQVSFGLYVDGVIGPCTWAALHPDTVPKDPSCFRPPETIPA